MHTGSCLCGAVSFTVACALEPPDACHCTNCRKSSGHYACGTDVPRSAVTVRGDDNVTWYQSSEEVRRGFCRTCGSPMFFDKAGRDWIGLMMGSFDGPTGTHVHVHIFTADKGDYYELPDDGVPKFPKIPPR
jgi:hypothetical protein